MRCELLYAQGMSGSEVQSDSAKSKVSRAGDPLIYEIRSTAHRKYMPRSLKARIEDALRPYQGRLAQTAPSIAVLS